MISCNNGVQYHGDDDTDEISSRTKEFSDDNKQLKREEDDPIGEEYEEKYLLPIEKQAKKLKMKKTKNYKLAEDELRLKIVGQEAFQFPNDEERDLAQVLINRGVK
ncbi:hypothetical protein FQA39_LY01542 [Lamprigera yunnana]|nr:hypothetical protein FQA39_LY01542 [Lamprigera yunnana]